MYLENFPGNCGMKVLTGLSVAAFSTGIHSDFSTGIKQAMAFARDNTHSRYLIATFNASQEENYSLSEHFEACGWEPVMHKEGRINPNSRNRIWVYMVDIRSSKMVELFEKWLKK